MGMEIVLTAVISEEDAGYTELQWQYSQDGKNWEDVADAKGISYSYELNEETAPLWWRVMATRTEEE
jgi:hypothetical protein